jgi:hypothetical protein
MTQEIISPDITHDPGALNRAEKEWRDRFDKAYFELRVPGEKVAQLMEEGRKRGFIR